MNIDADVKNISKLEDYFFVVPDYQREYVWKPDDQIEQFIADIDNEFDDSAKEQSSYFIGSIILVKNKEGKYDVIDGQQRLTTIVLMLTALRDILSPLEGTMDSKGKQWYKRLDELLSRFDLESEEIQLRLELQYKDSKSYLEKLITKEKFTEEKTSSIEKMEQAYDRLSQYARIMLADSQGKLLKFLKYFITKIEIVVIESENLSSALKIFETINQRGSGLNAMDLVKNLLFSEADEKDFEEIKNIWKDITKHLKDCGEEDSPLRFLRYFLMARYYNGILREDQIYKWIISKEGKASLGYQAQPLLFAKELEKIVHRYSKLVIATGYYKDGSAFPAVTRIGYVNKYRSRQHLIPFLALPITVSDRTIDYLANQLESFYFYSNTMGIQAKYNEGLFSNWSNKLRDVEEVEDVVRYVDERIVKYLKPKLAQFKESFLSSSSYNYNPQYRLRYILGKIENTILEQCNLPLNGFDHYHSLQIEHILPQTPKDGNIPEEFESMYEYHKYLHRLGNLALLEGMINQAVNNCNDLNKDWFERKFTEYAKSNLITPKLLNPNFGIGVNTALNRLRVRYAMESGKWTIASIEKRQEILLDFAFDAWRFNGRRLDEIIL